MTNPTRAAILALVSSHLLISPAFAHALHLFAAVEDGLIHGEVTYSGGKPAQNVEIAVIGPNNVTLGAAVTNTEGRFTFTPHDRVRHTFIADAGDGHRAQFNLSANQLPERLGQEPKTPATPQQPAAGIAEDELRGLVAAAVSREIRPLREELDAQNRRVRLHDIIGGIGYIVGVMGLIALIKRRGAPQA